MLTRKLLFPFFIALALISGVGIHIINISVFNDKSAYEAREKKKILILTSSGGGGHTSATEALEHYLQDEYAITKLHIFSDLLNKLDIFKILSFNLYTAENLYNCFIAHKYFRLLSFFYRFGAWYIYLQRKSIRTLLLNYLIEKKPDVIISVIPIINHIVLDIAQELNIPFLLIPTDLDIQTYIPYINNPTYKQFYIALPFADEQIMTPLHTANISAEHISIIGAPLRPGFFTKKNKSSLKKNYGVAKNKTVIMIMMGAQGSSEIKTYLTHLIALEHPVHCIVCTGKNTQIKHEIQALILPPHITMSIMEFGVNIDDLMAISDMLITKSGTLSIYEAMYSNLPMLLDATSAILPWEKLNHTFIKEHQFGESITQYNVINPIVSTLLNDNDLLNNYRNNLKNYEKKKTEQEIKKLIARIITQ